MCSSDLHFRFADFACQAVQRGHNLRIFCGKSGFHQRRALIGGEQGNVVFQQAQLVLLQFGVGGKGFNQVDFVVQQGGVTQGGFEADDVFQRDAGSLHAFVAVRPVGKFQRKACPNIGCSPL